MDLYVGGSSQGKLSYVVNKYNIPYGEETIADGRVCTREELFTKKIVIHFHEYIRRLLEEEIELEELITQVLRKNPEIIIISNEVGYGIVPMEKKDRVYREVVGRCLTVLAKKATIFERIVCGFGMRLK